MSVRRLALVVGIDQYKDKSIRLLRCGVNDARAVEELLVSLDYAPVTLLCEKGTQKKTPTRARLLQALDDLTAQVKKYQDAGDTTLVLFYFAGHGTLEKGRAVLVPWDGVLDDLATSGLAVTEIRKRLQATRAQQVVMMLDACHCGISTARDLEPVSDEKFVASLDETAEGFVLLTASTAKQQAQEADESGHGIFTGFLLRGLSGDASRNGQFVSVSDLYVYLSKNVRSWANKNAGRRQSPTEYIKMIGDIRLSDRLPGPQRWDQPVGPPCDAFPPRRFGPWKSLGALPGPRELPAAVYEGSCLHLFTRDKDGALLQRTCKSDEWSANWQRCDGGATRQLAAAPAVYVPAEGSFEVVALSADNHLLHRSGKDGKWSDWEDLGDAPGDGSPPVLLVRQNRGWQFFDVLLRGKDGQLWCRHKQPQSGWNNWFALPGLQLASAPAAYSWDWNKLAVYALGNDLHLYQRSCSSWTEGQWGRWFDLGQPAATVTASPQATTQQAVYDAPAARSRGPNHLDLFVMEASGRLQQKTWFQCPQEWSAWCAHDSELALVHGPVVAAPPTDSPMKDCIDLFAIDKKGELYQKRWRG